MEHLLTGIGIIVALIALYLAWKKSSKAENLAKEHHAIEQTENLQSKIAETYVKNANNAYANGLPGLINAGICKATSDEIIRDIITEITPRVKKSPLGSNPDKFKDIDLANFFSYVSQNKSDLYKKTIDQLINEYRKNCN